MTPKSKYNNSFVYYLSPYKNHVIRATETVELNGINQVFSRGDEKPQRAILEFGHYYPYYLLKQITTTALDNFLLYCNNMHIILYNLLNNLKQLKRVGNTKKSKKK